MTIPSVFSRWVRNASLPVFVFALVLPAHAGSSEREVHLGLNEYLRMVMEHNEMIQAQLLGTEASRERALAEHGIFEPEFVGSAQHVRNKRPNTVEQQRNLAGVPILNERNNLFDAGIEALTITGAKVRLGYTLNNYHNNLPPLGDPNAIPTDEWQSFGGVSFTQPLLKNGGPTATLANLRLAAINSESSFQEYRRQLMVTLSQAESAYWGVYFAQEQLRYLDESVKMTESILADSKERAKAGVGTELDILEAESGVALRRTKRNEALQRYNESVGQLLVQAGTSPLDDGTSYRVSDAPATDLPVPSLTKSWSNAIELNPDYLIQKKKLDEALIRLGVARNQDLPELNLKGSWGVNGLSGSTADSVHEASHAGFPSYSLGVEMRVPLGGNIRGRHELTAAQLTVDQVQLQIQNMERQIANALNTSIKKLQASTASSADYRTMITFNENLLKSERDRLNVGKVEGRRVLEVEAGLYEVKQGLADALVQAERADLEVQLAEGSILRRRNLDFTAAELKERTRILLGKDEKKKAKPSETVDDKPVQKKSDFTPSTLKVRGKAKG